MTHQPKQLIDNLREIEGYGDASKVAYNLLFESMGDLNSDLSKSIQKIAPKIKLIRAYKILVNTGKDNKENMTRILKSMLKHSPQTSESKNVETMSYEELDETFLKISRYWIEELYKLQG